MGFLKRMASILGFLHGAGADDGDGGGEDEDQAVGRDEAAQRRASPSSSASARKGFSVQVPVPVARPQEGPVLIPCDVGEGGVQGLKWYGERLRVDEDGDVADEFLDEVLPDEAPELNNRRALPKFKVKYSTLPAAVREQVMVADGSVLHGVEHKGRLQWV